MIRKLIASLALAVRLRRGSPETLNDDRPDDGEILMAEFGRPGARLPAAPVGRAFMAQQRRIDELEAEVASLKGSR